MTIFGQIVKAVLESPRRGLSVRGLGFVVALSFFFELIVSCDVMYD